MAELGVLSAGPPCLQLGLCRDIDEFDAQTTRANEVGKARGLVIVINHPRVEEVAVILQACDVFVKIV